MPSESVLPLIDLVSAFSMSVKPIYSILLFRSYDFQLKYVSVTVYARSKTLRLYETTQSW